MADEVDEPALADFLAAVSGVVSLAGGRVFAMVIPQHDFRGQKKIPCVVVSRTGGERQQLMCRQDDLVSAQYQVDAYASEYETAVRLARAVRVALVAHAGLMGRVNVAKVFCDSDSDFLDPDPGLYRRFMQFTIWHHETVAA